MSGPQSTAVVGERRSVRFETLPFFGETRYVGSPPVLTFRSVRLKHGKRRGKSRRLGTVRPHSGVPPPGRDGESLTWGPGATSRTSWSRRCVSSGPVPGASLHPRHETRRTVSRLCRRPPESPSLDLRTRTLPSLSARPLRAVGVMNRL